MDYAKTERRLLKGIKKFFAESGKTKAVVGLSGGIDSAVVLALLARALGSKNVCAMMMPNTSITKEQNMIDAENLVRRLGTEHHMLEIDGFLRAFIELPWHQNGVAKANLNARVRAVILYNYANSNGALVAGTGNKSEFYMGYFTKYGDAAADFFPIGALLKKDVRGLARRLGIPDEFLEKAPTAELWEGQEDEKEMGIAYEVLDELLPVILKEKKGKISAAHKKTAGKILALMKATEHKREQAPILPV